MSNSFLPPQAFTSQEVSRAMKWLENQPNHIKAMAKNKDALMSLYKQALVYKDEFYDRYPPVSEEKFRADLNNLANQLSSFSENQQNLEGPPPIEIPIEPEPIMPTQQYERAQILEAQEAAPSPKRRVEKEKVHFSVERERSFEEGLDLEKHLDPLSYQRLMDVKKRFNLSTDEEALRMLISLAFERIQKL